MLTKTWDIQIRDLNTSQAQTYLHEIAAALHAGAVIGMPTETVYGLAADARNDQAISRVFEAKGRPSDNPLIIHIHDESQLDAFTTHVDDKVRKLMARFWPGPLSIILPLKSDVLADAATAGLKTVAVRMPSHEVARAVLKAADIPIAAPSANTSGKPSPTDGHHVLDDLNGKIYGVINSDTSVVGLESTVIDCTSYPFRIVRPGAITKRDLEEVLKDSVTTDTANNAVPISPGMKYKHYSPRQPVRVVENWPDITPHIEQEPRVIGVIAPNNMKQHIKDGVHFIGLCKDAYDYEEAARNLYRALRDMDNSNVEVIYLHGFVRNEESAALNDRIYRAAGNTIIEG